MTVHDRLRTARASACDEAKRGVVLFPSIVAFFGRSIRSECTSCPDGFVNELTAADVTAVTLCQAVMALERAAFARLVLTALHPDMTAILQ